MCFDSNLTYKYSGEYVRNNEFYGSRMYKSKGPLVY